MAEKDEIRREIARELLTMFPPSVRRSIFGSRIFREKYGFEVDSTLTFSGSQISINRSAFFPAVRSLYAGEKSVDVPTAADQVARLEVEPDNDDGRLRVTVGDQVASIPSFWFLSPDTTLRLREFDREVSRRTLPDPIVDRWRNRFAESALSDEEAAQFHDELTDDPREVAEAIGNELQQPEAELRILVPRAMEYYRRLLGDFDKSTGVESYLQTIAPPHFEHLLRSGPQRGLSQCLRFCAHQLMASLLKIPEWAVADVERFFGWLEQAGDRFSQVAGFEVGIRVIDRYPTLEPILLRIAKTIRDEDTSGKSGRLALSAGLFIFVDGELSRIGLFREYRPFIRRLAAIGHAAAIERNMVRLGFPLDDAADWAMHGRGQDFFMQTLADLRLEPRWLPDLMDAEQLRFEFLSRIHIAADHAKELIPPGELRQLVLEEALGSVKANMTLPYAFLPGPLEGGAPAPVSFPQDMLEELREPKDGKVLEAQFFAGVVNLALVFKLEQEVAQLIAGILRTVKYRLSVGNEPGVTFSFLAGLAVVAAVTRSPDLASEVRVLARVLRARGDLDAKPDSQMRIAMVACAAHEDLAGWCKAVGDWLVELSYEPMDANTARLLRHHLRKLCQIIPDMWRHVSKADAALTAVAGPRRS